MATRSITHNGQTFDLNYTLLNPSADPTLLILHGWGSDQRIMQQALASHLKHYRQIYLDLPGFGKSPNDRPLTTEDYARIVRAFLETLGEEPTAILGHSFGGKVATLLDPPLLVLLSSAGIPVRSPNRGKYGPRSPFLSSSNRWGSQSCGVFLSVTMPKR